MGKDTEFGPAEARRSRLLAELSPQFLWESDREGRTVHVNEWWCEYTGLDREQGCVSGWQATLHPAHRERVGREWERALREQDGWEAEALCRRADGSHRWHLLRGRPLRDAGGRLEGWIGVGTDIHERREAEERLRRQTEALEAAEARYRALGETSSFAVWVCDAQGQLEFMSRSFLDLLGVSFDELRRSGWVHAMSPEEGESALARWKECLRSGHEWGGELRFRGADGRRYIVLTSGRPVRDARGHIRSWVGINFDITGRNALEAERDQLLASERAARSEAQRAARLADEFMATLSHELRTPLNAIVGWVEVLRRNPGDAATVQRACEVLERNVRVQRQMVDDLLDVNSMLAGKLILNLEDVPLEALLRDALSSVSREAAAKRLVIVREGHSAAVVRADPPRLLQVLTNLLTNAVKFTPEGGRVTLGVRDEPHEVEIEVRDTGVGIRPDFLPHVFDRFRQADGVMSRRSRGLGLGLSIVRRLTDLHGGHVRARSEGEGRGASFVLRLPREDQMRSAADSEPGIGPETAWGLLLSSGHDGGPLRSLRVLVVDDERDARELAERVLGDHGAEVRTACSVAEALVCLGEAPVDVVVTDIGMPDENGYALLRRLQAGRRGRACDTAVIALTAFARDEDRRRAEDAGFDGYLTKPYHVSELVSLVAAFRR